MWMYNTISGTDVFVAVIDGSGTFRKAIFWNDYTKEWASISLVYLRPPKEEH